MLSNSHLKSLHISSIHTVRSRSNGRYSRSKPTLLLLPSFAGAPSTHWRVSLLPFVRSSSIHRAKTMAPEIPFDPSTCDLAELINEADFHSLCSPDGFLSICGFGSLLSGLIFSLSISISSLSVSC